MERICVVTGAASGVGAATARRLREGGDRVIACDLHSADVIANLTTAEGRAALIEGVTRLSSGRIDAIIANAGGGAPETLLSLNFFGAVATLEGLRPLLETSAAPRAVAVSSIAALRPPYTPIVEACLSMDEPGAIAAARRCPTRRGRHWNCTRAAKYALQRWCRTAARQPQWAGAGIALNVIALGVFDTPAAATILSDPASRAAMGAMVPMRGAFPGRPEEAAAILAWAVSPENSQMTGQILYADGGFECRARGDRTP